jgi:hypothetical protein
MWRVALSIVAVILNAALVLIGLLGAIGFAIDMATRQMNGSDWPGFALVLLALAGGVISIVAIAIGARLPRAAKASAAQVAAEFS